jgi:hypothetical protein
MTWFAHEGGFDLFFNRDERRSRKPARGPAIRDAGRLRCIAPADGDFGGTWIAINTAGLACCLLNGADADGAPGPDRPRPSRGAIPLALAGCPAPAAAAEALRALSLDDFAPFTLVGLAPGGPALVGRWTGADLAIELRDRIDQPLVSSSFCTEAVRSHRAAVFARLVGEPGSDPTSRHLEYHRRHDPEAGPFSPCMHRPDAETVSFSWVGVDAREIRFRYAPHAPCRGEPGPAVVLPRS